MKHILILVLFALLLAGCGTTASVKKDQPEYTPTMKLDANFTIENWNATKIGDEWNVTIFFEMTNTGNIQIAYYEVYFTVTCEDSSMHSGEGWGPYESLEKGHEGKVGDPIFPGSSSRGLGGAENCTSKPVSVKVTTWKLYDTRR
jgi:hypothetical protein